MGYKRMRDTEDKIIAMMSIETRKKNEKKWKREKRVEKLLYIGLISTTTIAGLSWIALDILKLIG